MKVGNSSLNIVMPEDHVKSNKQISDNNSIQNTPADGLKINVKRIEEMSKTIVNKSVNSQDYTQDIVKLKEYENAAKANIKAYEAKNNTLGMLIDTRV